MERQPRTDGAFTLIEVLIALAVIAIGLLAVMTVAARSGEVAASLQNHTFAQWIAQNRLTQLRLSPQWPKIGESDDDVTFAGRKWRWHVTVADTADPDLRRATVEVAFVDSPDDPITQLIGFIGKPNSTQGVPPAAPASAPHARAASSTTGNL